MELLKGFYIYVLAASILTIGNNLDNLLNPTIAVSMIGILATILFFLKKYDFYFLGIIWIVAQIPYFVLNNFILDLSQFINFHFSLTFGSMSIGINMQVFLLFFFKQLSLSEFLFKKVSFKAYTENQKLKISNEYFFIPTDIRKKKLFGTAEINIENDIYSSVEFEPLKSERIKKAGISLISENEIPNIKTSVKYKLNNDEW